QVGDVEPNVPGAPRSRFTVVAQIQVGEVAGGDGVVVDVHPFHPARVPQHVRGIALLYADAERSDVVAQRANRSVLRRAAAARRVEGYAAQRSVGIFQHLAAKETEGQRLELIAKEVRLHAVDHLEVDAL